MTVKITLITFRTALTLGDVMGAYRTIQALCKDISTFISVDFIIMVEDPSSLVGLKNQNGSPILVSPNNNVEFKVHFLNTAETEKEQRINTIKVKYIASNFFANMAGFLMGKLKFLKYIGMESASNFLVRKSDEYEVLMIKSRVLSVLRDQTGKYGNIPAIIKNTDLLLLYSLPSLLMSILQIYNEHKKISLPKEVWFIPEYNGGDTQYRALLEKARTYPTPSDLQLKLIDTGFPEQNNTTQTTFGVFSDIERPRALTDKEKLLLNKLGYSDTNLQQQSGLFFGYVNYSTDGDGFAVLNPLLNVEFFATTAIKQYLAFQSAANQKEVKIDIIAPFSKKNCENIARKMQMENSNVQFYSISCNKEEDLISMSLQADAPMATDIITVRLINIFPLTPALFKRLLEMSEPFTIQTGDQSFIEALMNKKVPLYQVMSWKPNFYVNFLYFFLNFVTPKTETIAENVSLESVESRVEIIDSRIAFLDSKMSAMKFSGHMLSTLNSRNQNTEMDGHLQGITDLITNKKSFEHLSLIFQAFANKIHKELNTGDKLRDLLKKSFSESITFNEAEKDEKNNAEKAVILDQQPSSCISDDQVFLPYYLNVQKSQQNSPRETHEDLKEKRMGASPD